MFLRFIFGAKDNIIDDIYYSASQNKKKVKQFSLTFHQVSNRAT